MMLYYFHTFIKNKSMKFLSLEPFVPSGNNFEGSKLFFEELGFSINWDAGDYIGFEKDGCKFILQKYDKKDFAENFMVSVGISNAQEFWNEVNEKQLPQKFGVKLGKPTEQPYGKEVNIIDIAGVCWHFVEQLP
jgi:hypothetical protein